MLQGLFRVDGLGVQAAVKTFGDLRADGANALIMLLALRIHVPI